MTVQGAKDAFAHASSMAPTWVSKKSKTREDVLLGFFGHPSAASANRVISFQGSLLKELGVRSKLTKVESGCFECTFELKEEEDANRLATMIDLGQFDSLAYRYRILFIRFLSSPQLDEFYFERDSLYR